MTEEFSQLNEQERLEAENEFMKFKLMAENGAIFGSTAKNGLPAEVEHEFLKSILAFEKQHPDRPTVRVYEKIGRPTQFKPEKQVPDKQMEKAWKELKDYLAKHGVQLNVFSPNVTPRELYKFAIEELFELETEELEMPGWTTCYIYDEFHPDPLYESEKAVKEDFLPGLFNAEPVAFYFLCLSPADILLNGVLYPTGKDVVAVFDRFKSFYSKIGLQEVHLEPCKMTEPLESLVTGTYKATAIAKGDHSETSFEGGFTIRLEPDDSGYWGIKDIEIMGLKF